MNKIENTKIATQNLLNAIRIESKCIIKMANAK